jgi:hypothetical protein
MEIIALSGYARSGKDEAAKVLVEQFGFKQVAFADKLRQFLYALNPMIDKYYTEDWPNGDQPNPVMLQGVIDHYGWDGYKETKYGREIRRLLQRLGTEGGRKTLWDSIWIDAAFTGLPDDAKIVVSDARFFNEFDAVRERGGYIWRIERPGVGPVSDHPSETEATNYDKFSLYLDNNGTLEDWHELVANEYESGRYKEWSYA